MISLIKIIEASGTYADLEMITERIYTDIGNKTLDHLKAWGYRNHFKLGESLWHAKRIPIPELSKKNQQRLYDCIVWLEDIKKAVDGFTVENKIRYLFEHTPTRNLIADLPASQSSFNQLLNMSKAFGENVQDFLAAAALQTDTDTYHAKTEKVSLMTMHAAKGLEFPIVFIAGCEEGLIPHRHSYTDLDEERRLFYVAMTRAKEQLYLTSAKHRLIYGKRISRKLSPFVAAIEARLRVHETGKSKKTKKTKEDRIQLKLF
jgi:superfamily I DNA/RNA helicase